MLDRYRNGLGRHVKKTMDHILDAEFGFVNGKLPEVFTRKIAPPLMPPPAPDANGEGDKAAPVNAAIGKDQSDGGTP